MTTYADFLTAKTQLDGDFGFDPEHMPGFLYPFQDALVRWALRKGRAALFADCGLGKTPMQLVWADQVHRRTGRPVLILTPLAVSYQTEEEAGKFGIDAAVSRDGTLPAPLTITNYDRLHLFNPDHFGAVVCDESSAIKAFDGARRAMVTEFLRLLPHRLLATATAAPNDYVELGTSSEALGYLGHMDMLARFFTNKDKSMVIRRPGRWNTARDEHGMAMVSGWRFKGHAEQAFWRWVASWARALRRPSDFGYPDEGFDLPPLNVVEHVVEAAEVADGTLFDVPALSLREELDEQRRTLTERCERAAALLEDAPAAVAWCHRNDESALLARLIPGSVEVKGSDTPEAKEAALIAFSHGEARVLVTKPSVAGWGLNWQHCHRMTYFPSHSYEQYYQAVRRCWRYGQESPVTVDVVTTEGGSRTLANLQRKAGQADRMFSELVAHMTDELAIRRSDDYTVEAQVPSWV